MADIELKRNTGSSWASLYPKTKWSQIFDKPIEFTPETHDHTKSDITNFPTEMPASDVYAWAKASSKPSYTFSEITGTTDPSQIPNLDAGKITSGVIDKNRLPSIAITNNYTDTTMFSYQSFYNNTTGNMEGDVLILTEDEETYIHNGGTAGNASDWTKLETPTDKVTSVAGKTGVVSLVKGDVNLENVEDKSSATIRSEITSSNVTNALGFTPMSTSHPANNHTANHLYMANGDGFVWDDVNNIMKVRRDGVESRLYHTGHKPTASEVGALADNHDASEVTSTKISNWNEAFNEYISNVTGSGDGNLTFTRRDGGNFTVNLAHSHSEYMLDWDKDYNDLINKPDIISLGETSETAYRGDRGKTAYDHSQTTHAPSNAEANVQADWDATSGDAFIKNKPTIPDLTGYYNSASDLPYAASTTKGAVRVSTSGTTVYLYTS